MDYRIDPKTFRAWLIGARSPEVKKGRITARTIMGQTLIFYRDATGRAVALDSLCPHKGVSLADAKMRGDEVECPYHGWRFDTDGKLTRVPSASASESLPCAKLQRFPIVEQDGWVWVYWGDASEHERGSPPRFPMQEDIGWFESVREVKAPPHFILENSFDCVHANFVHAGLARNQPTQDVTAHMEETSTGVRITTRELGNTASSALTRLVPWVSSDLHHTDELVLPFTAHVNYFFGPIHHQTILTCVPIDEETTRVYTRSGVKAGLWTPLVTGFFRVITPFVIPQDAKVLENQARTVKQYNARYGHPQQSDVPGFWAMRAYRDFLEGKPARSELRTGDAVYKL